MFLWLRISPLSKHSGSNCRNTGRFPGCAMPLCCSVSCLRSCHSYPFIGWWLVRSNYNDLRLPPPPPPPPPPIHLSFSLATRPWITGNACCFDRPAVQWLFNSFVVAGGIALTSVITSSMAGYAFGKKRFPGRTVLFWAFLLTMMLPRQIYLIPLFILMREFDWFNTYQGMIAPYIVYPFWHLPDAAVYAGHSR